MIKFNSTFLYAIVLGLTMAIFPQFDPLNIDNIGVYYF